MELLLLALAVRETNYTKISHAFNLKQLTPSLEM